ncbi:hypothetical protein CPT_Mendera_079 [Stenotrophomonas phage Mendera]|uniref:Uncharacterized protein n=1 Tax=Stenotrophomonas phage Mendera TaxID=2650877 RepID=A0A5P8PIR6_9CAUD|nr:hypothetical protein HWC60_gp079 [Stenotrophomonas phage Mendera]QFR56628.1 hypothetical protein CPT_Mendera_079 [Stenotrophomonas phage Mendera]
MPLPASCYEQHSQDRVFTVCWTQNILLAVMAKVCPYCYLST